MTRIKSIRKRCLDCQPDNRNDVLNCEITDCHLWYYRMGKDPFTRQNKNPIKKPYKINPSIAIRKYCVWCMNGSAPEVRLCTSNDCPLWNYRVR